MLSSTFVGSYKQSRRCHCRFDKALINSRLWLKEKPQSKQYFTMTRINLDYKNPTLKFRKTINLPKWIHTTPRHLESSKPVLTEINNDKDYNTILSIALDQSNGPITQSLVEKAFHLLRKGNPQLAWECYIDITSRQRQKYISREQYKQLIKSFNHAKTNHEQGLEYILTLVEDMKQLGYQVGRKEKLLVMRLLGLNGKISAMETVFEDLCKEQLLVVTDLAAAQKPFNIMLTSYNDYVDLLSPEKVAEKSMNVYGDMLDYNIQPAAGTTRLLMNNIRLTNNSDEMVEKVWSWVWTKIGMNVGGKTKELEPSLYREMVLYFSSAGRSEYALEINDIMTKKNISRDVRMMTALIHKVGRAGDIEKAMELFNDMLIVDHLVPNIVTLNALVDIHAHKKPLPDVDGANRVFNMINEVGLQPDIVTFGTMIDMHAKTGDLKNLKVLYDDMRQTYNLMPNPHIFSSLIECFIKLDDRQSAMNVLQLLTKQANRRAAPAREAYNLMFKGLIESGYIKDAFELLKAMSNMKSYLEAKTFAPLLSYFAKQGNTKSTQEVAAMMPKANVKPTSHTYAILLESFAKAGDIEGAENIFDMFKQKYRPNTYVYNSMLYLYTSKNEMDKVLDIYKRMSKAFVPANEYTYGILMNYYSKRKEVKAVEALLETMQANNISPGVICYTMLMQTYFECNRPEDGRSMFQHIVQAGLEPSEVTLNILIKGCIESDELQYAKSILEEAIENNQAFNQDKHTLMKDSELGTRHAYENYIPETIEDVLEKSNKSEKTKVLSPYLFVPVIDAYSKIQEFDKAKQLIKSMCDSSIPITIPVYTTVMNTFKNEKKYDAVEALWDGLYKPRESQTNVDIQDPHLPSLPLPKQIHNYIDLLSFEIGEIVPEQTSSFALSIYMDALLEQDRFDDIQTLWNQLNNEGYQFDEHNWNRYVSALIKSEQMDKACQIVQDELFGSHKEDNIKTIRKRDDIFITNDNPLHTRTCISFAQVFDIPGYKNMGEPRLRISVTKKIQEYLHQKDRTNLD